MTTAEFVERAFRRMSRGLPEDEAKLYRPAIQSIEGQALQRLADRVAADPVSYELLQREYSLTLVAGEVTLLDLSPPLLHSMQARKRWRITMTSVTNPLKALPNRSDLDNPPPISSYYYYSVFKGSLVVRKSDGTIPAETAVKLYGNYVPLINDTSLTDETGELSDDLIDIAIEIMANMPNMEATAKKSEIQPPA